MPSFNPCDGGDRARVLLLLEAPGPQAIRSGFVSRNDPDPSARNLLDVLTAAGLRREDSALWNIVPWCLGDEGRIRPATARDVAEGLELLGQLLAQLPRLEEVVLVGRQAQRVRAWLEGITPQRVRQISCTHHPSNRVFHRWPDRRMAVIESLREVACRLSAVARAD